MKRNSQVDHRLEFDLTHHPLLRDFEKVSNEAQILLSPNEEQKTASEENRKTCTLKYYLVRAKKRTFLNAENMFVDQIRWEYLKYEIRIFSIHFSAFEAENETRKKIL